MKVGLVPMNSKSYKLSAPSQEMLRSVEGQRQRRGERFHNAGDRRAVHSWSGGTLNYIISSRRCFLLIRLSFHCLYTICCGLFLVEGDDLIDTGVRATDKCQHRQQDQHEVLDHPPAQRAPVLRLLPEGKQLDDRGAEQAQDGKADCTHQ